MAQWGVELASNDPALLSFVAQLMVADMERDFFRLFYKDSVDGYADNL